MGRVRTTLTNLVVGSSGHVLFLRLPGIWCWLVIYCRISIAILYVKLCAEYQTITRSGRMKEFYQL